MERRNTDDLGEEKEADAFLVDRLTPSRHTEMLVRFHPMTSDVISTLELQSRLGRVASSSCKMDEFNSCGPYYSTCTLEFGLLIV